MAYIYINGERHEVRSSIDAADAAWRGLLFAVIWKILKFGTLGISFLVTLIYRQVKKLWETHQVAKANKTVNYQASTYKFQIQPKQHSDSQKSPDPLFEIHSGYKKKIRGLR